MHHHSAMGYVMLVVVDNVWLVMEGYQVCNPSCWRLLYSQSTITRIVVVVVVR